MRRATAPGHNAIARPSDIERVYDLGMAYAQPFLRLVAIGDLYGVEDWSFSMSLIADDDGPGATPTEVPSAIVNAFQTWFNTGSLISNAARLLTLKLNLIGEDGRYVNPTTVQYDYTSIPVGNSSTKVPAQIAYAVSLRTALSRGRAHAGRFYVPVPALSPNADGQISVSAIAAPTDTLLASIQGAIPGYVLGVTSSIGSGAEQRVVNARYGRILDTIRSRRDKLPEDYVDAAPLPIP